jgi:hypothetical protein
VTFLQCPIQQIQFAAKRWPAILRQTFLEIQDHRTKPP